MEGKEGEKAGGARAGVGVAGNWDVQVYRGIGLYGAVQGCTGERTGCTGGNPHAGGRGERGRLYEACMGACIDVQSRAKTAKSGVT